MTPKAMKSSLNPTNGAQIERSLFRAAYYRLIPIIFQQLNFAEWPQFCDHSVTSADVRLSVGPISAVLRACDPSISLLPGAD